MEDIKLLRGDDYIVNDKIKVRHLTINEIVDFTPENGELHYFSLINLFILRPYDVMDKLDEAGIDYENITDYDLFINFFRSGIFNNDLKLLLGNYNFEASLDSLTNSIVLYDSQNNVIINKDIYEEIRDFLIKIHHIKLAPVRKAGNDSIKKFRIKQKRSERKKLEDIPYKSQLLDLVSSIIVGTNGSVTFFNIWDMPVYAAYTAFDKTLKLQNYSNVMLGVYTGNVNLSDISKDVLDWTTSS